MNKKKQIIGIATFGMALLSACQSENALMDENSNEEVALTFTPTVAGMAEESVSTRATTNTFFVAGDSITLNVTTDKMKEEGAFEEYTYKYGEDGVFTGGNKPFRFKLDNTYIKTLKALWPTEVVRKEGVVLDQRKEEDYKKSDRLKAEAAQINVMPTAEPVPLNFTHEQSRFTFRMAGQNANGLNIESLILELQYDDPYDDKGTENVPGAFWAYCNNTETAELILLPDMEISGGKDKGYPIVNERYMIGQATVGNDDIQYTGGIWLKEGTSITLAPGTDYLVTLTPEGYNLSATIEVHGFGQSEGYVGVPLQKPTVSTTSSVDYEITTALQLMTLSRYINGKVNTEKADDWKGKTYHLADKLEMTTTAKPYFITLPTNSCAIKNTSGGDVKTIAIEGSTETLNLFAE